MIEARGINAFYDASHILFDVSLGMGCDDRVAIVGRNGAGKSTLLKSLMNAGPRVDGDVVLDGNSLGSTPTHRRARLGLQLIPEDRRIYGHLTVRENIHIASHARPKKARPRNADEILALFPILVPLAERLGFQLSGGQQQILAIARAFAASPRLMLLDEPTEGVAPAIVQSMVATIRTLCSESGMGLLLCEQNLWFARQLTDRVVVMDTGHIVFDASWQEFQSRPEIMRTHLAV